MPFTFTTLNAATATGPGSTFTFDLPTSEVTMQWSGAGTSGNIWLQLSLDGVNFSDVMQGTGDNGLITSSGHIAVAARARLANLTSGNSVTAVLAVEPNF